MATNTNDFGFKGSSVAFSAATPTTLGKLRSIDYSESGVVVDVSGASDALKRFRAGIPDITMTITVVGPLASGTGIGAQGDLTVAWQDDTTTDGAITDAIVVDRGKAGSMDGEVISTYTFKPGQVDAD